MKSHVLMGPAFLLFMVAAVMLMGCGWVLDSDSPDLVALDKQIREYYHRANTAAPEFVLEYRLPDSPFIGPGKWRDMYLESIQRRKGLGQAALKKCEYFDTRKLSVDGYRIILSDCEVWRNGKRYVEQFDFVAIPAHRQKEYLHRFYIILDWEPIKWPDMEKK